MLPRVPIHWKGLEHSMEILHYVEKHFTAKFNEDSDFTTEVFVSCSVFSSRSSEKEYFNCSRKFIPRLVHMIRVTNLAREFRKRKFKFLGWFIVKMGCICHATVNIFIYFWILYLDSNFKFYGDATAT